MLIRQATVDDIPTIYRFICELADYQKQRHQVVATPAVLVESLFGDRAHADVILAIDNNVPIGFALFFHNFSTFIGKPGLHLEDLYVVPTARGQGVGKQLLAYVAQVAIDRDCQRLEWCVLNWNTPAIEFYHAVGAQSMDDWITYRLTDNALADLAAQIDGGVVEC